ncbi:MAG TPA: dienelactone hydrolase family protein, partial [Lysobacter sp.]|nr:dienelactone hydrolase family protein [Lysobacter sp.]
MRLLKSRYVAALALFAFAAPAFAAMQAKPVEWKVGKDSFSGVLVYDDTNGIKRPGLVMVPDWKGVTDNAVAKARHIAGDDYVVL